MQGHRCTVFIYENCSYCRIRIFPNHQSDSSSGCRGTRKCVHLIVTKNMLEVFWVGDFGFTNGHHADIQCPQVILPASSTTLCQVHSRFFILYTTMLTEMEKKTKEDLICSSVSLDRCMHAPTPLLAWISSSSKSPNIRLLIFPRKSPISCEKSFFKCEYMFCVFWMICNWTGRQIHSGVTSLVIT